MSREATQSQRDWLEGEIAAWQGMGLIDEQRAQAVLGLYESRESFDAGSNPRDCSPCWPWLRLSWGLGCSCSSDTTGRRCRHRSR